MHPISTVYRLAKAGGEFNKLYALAKRTGLALEGGTLNFPTVVAEREGKILGFLSTLKEPAAVLAGPLVVETGKMFTALRLIEAYEVVMKTAGVRTYLAQVAPNADEWADQLVRMGFEVMNKDEERIQLRRDL